MSEIESTSNTRPTSITVICVIGFIGALIAIQVVFSPLAKLIGAWYPPYLGLSSIVGLVCMIGLWNMKKWAAHTYIGFAGLNQFFLMAIGAWKIMALTIPAIIIFFVLKHSPEMT